MKTWAYLTWFPEHGASLVHGSDRAALGSGIQGLIGGFELGADGWYAFTFREQQVRVRVEALTPCNEPAFKYGEEVRALPPRTAVLATVAEIRWHFKEQTHFFLLSGKNSSRYWAHEFERAAQQRAAGDVRNART
jgi:hypothetical protein